MALDRSRSRVEFAVTKVPGIRVEGRFTDFRGWIRYDAERPERSAVRWSARVESVQTGERGRDETLQSGDYFLASSHPEIGFVSSRVRARGDGSMDVDGILTIRGITKPIRIVVVPSRTPQGTPAFSTRFHVDRFDFGVKGGRVMRAAISRQVEIRLLAVADLTG
jgi:polyisoprenoid-binding protein YceI